jgi:GNAT superfamily N-acetyltransferase
MTLTPALRSDVGHEAPSHKAALTGGVPYLVASINNIIVGYANWMGDELMSLFVQPNYHRTGIGSALFDACDQQNRISRVKATLSAVGFYRRFGFLVDHEGFDVKREVRIPHIFMRRSPQ